MWALSIFFGAIVGFSLGLTGGGGAIFAVPLLVYGLSMSPREAVGTSLASVGAMSLAGFLGWWRAGQVEVRTGLLFAAAGMLGAPFGTWLSRRTPPGVLLGLFAVLMLVVAQRMWSKSRAKTIDPPILFSPDSVTVDAPTCQRDEQGRLRLTSPCARLLLLLGVATGVLSGLFGVGGGFVIVPALVLFSGMAIHLAIGTSLLVITLVSLSGVASQFIAGGTLSFEITALFVLGGLAGMFMGNRAGRRLPAAALQKVFAIAIVLVAVFVIVRTVTAPG
jgi:uncharacterized membrane protein YfcA